MVRAGDATDSGPVRTAWLQAPVTALCVDVKGNSGGVFFAVGNEVWQAGEDDAAVSLRTARLAFDLPRGCTVTALHYVARGKRDGPAGVLLAATADRVFAAPHGDACDGWVAWRPATCVLCTHGERVLCIRDLGAPAATATTLIAAMTVAGTVFVLDADAVAGGVGGAANDATHSANAALLTVCAGPATGVTFAMDCVTHTMHESATGCCHVLVATYTGEVVEWSLALPRTGAARDSTACRVCNVQSRFAAHCPGCAVFALHAFCLPDSPTTGGLHPSKSCPAMYVATCGDDRSVTLYCRAALAEDSAQAMTGSSWLCLWRGYGERFSRGRIFDIALRLDTRTRRHVWCAVGSEDGGVQVVHVSLQTDATHGADTVLRRAGQHEGHGVYKVALVAPRTAATPDDVVVISGGFDGSVVCTGVHCDRAGLTLPVLSSVTHEVVVRGVAIDQAGCTVVCTTRELLVLAAPPVSSASEVADVVHRATWLSAASARAIVGDSTDEGVRAVRDCLPTSLAVLDLTHEAPCAVLAMKNGCMVALPYTRGARLCSPSVHDAAADGEVTVCNAWRDHGGGGVRLAAVSLQGGADGGCVVSVHVTGAILVTRLRAAVCVSSPRVILVQVQQLHSLSAGFARAVSLLDVYLMPDTHHGVAVAAPLLVVIGSKHGTACCLVHHATRSSMTARDAEPPVAGAGEEMQVFAAGTAVAAAYLVQSHSAHLVLVAHDGGVATLPVASTQASEGMSSASCASPPPCPHPLRFSRGIAQVLLASDVLWVTQYGTTVTVYARTLVGSSALLLRGGWHAVACYTNVKAPRLLTARLLLPPQGMPSSSPSAVFAHCSDGRTVHVKRCDAVTALSHGDIASPVLPPRTASALLHGGVLPGKDLNCCLHLPASLSPQLLCGGEDTSLTFVSHCDEARGASALSLYGPHHANILALCALPLAGHATPVASGMGDDGNAPRYVVTVGGAASIALWHCDPAAESSWAVQEALCDTATAVADATTAVPRYLAVCAVGGQTVVVGGSDATLRCYTVHTVSPPMLRARTHMMPNPAAPKPILCLSTLTAHPAGGDLMAGDSNGMLFLARVGLGKGAAAPTCIVLAQLRVEASAVNAISAARPRRSSVAATAARQSWLVATLQDSGMVHLLGVESTEHATVPAMTRLSCVTAGITAGRGICWSPACANELLAACEGGLARVAVHAATLRLHCRRRTATNIRGVSGMAAWCTVAEKQQCMVAIVGQGIEILTLSASEANEDGTATSRTATAV